MTATEMIQNSPSSPTDLPPIASKERRPPPVPTLKGRLLVGSGLCLGLGHSVSWLGRTVFNYPINAWDCSSTFFVLLITPVLVEITEKGISTLIGDRNCLDEAKNKDLLSSFRRKAWTVIVITETSINHLNEKVDNIFFEYLGIRPRKEVDDLLKVNEGYDALTTSEIVRLFFLSALKDELKRVIPLKIAIAVGFPFLIPFIVSPYFSIVCIASPTILKTYRYLKAENQAAAKAAKPAQIPEISV